MRAESANVIVLSEPLSLVITTALPVTDLTVPTAFAGVCEMAAAAHKSAAEASMAKPARRIKTWVLCEICTLFYSIMRSGARGVKNCQTWVKIGGISQKLLMSSLTRGRDGGILRMPTTVNVAVSIGMLEYSGNEHNRQRKFLLTDQPCKRR